MDRYELKEELGDGSFGRVMKARHKKTDDVVAIKHIKRKLKSWNAIVDLREVQSLRKLSHPNIVKMTEVILERDEDLYFVFEYMAGGSLYDLTKVCIEDRNKGKPERLTKDQITVFVRQILSALSFMHGEGFVHRDIKPENILLNENRSSCKVADFGLAREVSRDDDITYYVSTRWYRAPEVILRCSAYGKPVDIFATGLILAELCSLQPLFPGASEIDQINKMVALLGPPTDWEEGTARMKQLNFRLASPAESTHDHELVESAIRSTMPSSPAAAPLIRQMISWNPDSRPSADNALGHEYFASSTVPRKSDDTLFPSKITESQSNIGIHIKKLPTKSGVEPTQHKFFHDEIDIKRSQVSNAAGDNKNATSSVSVPKMSPDNEFSQYLNAISNTHSEATHTQQSGGRSKPSGNPFRPLTGRPENSNIRDGLLARTGVSRPTPSSRISRYKRTAEKPQWLLSNQNMSKRAMEVSIIRTRPNVNGKSSHNLDESQDDGSEDFVCCREGLVTKWTCDVSKSCSFETLEEAEAHEKQWYVPSSRRGLKRRET